MTELQDAMYLRLTDGSEDSLALTGALASYGGAPAIFTQPQAPDDATLGYVTVSAPVASEPEDTKDRDGIDVDLDVGVYFTNAGSDAAVNEAARRVKRLLHRRRLAVSGYTVIVAVARAPVVAPTDDTVVGRLVRARYMLRSWESRD